jgi:hypothetical protein
MSLWPVMVPESKLTEYIALIHFQFIAQGLLIRWLVAQVVLSACSPYFQRVLLDNPCKHPVLILPVGVGHADLRAIVEFIYRGETYVTRDQLSSIVRVAELLKIKGMQCEIISWLFFN